MKKFKAKRDGFMYKKGDILELIQKEADGYSHYRLKDGTETYAGDENLFEVYQPKFTKGDHVRVTGNSTKNGPHYADIGTIGRVEFCVYSKEYKNEMAFVRADDFGLQQYIGVQDLELIPKENNSTPKKYKVGDTVRITRCRHWHGFHRGEAVKIVRVTPRGNYGASNARGCWYVTEDEIEKVLLDKQGYPLAVGDKVMICTSDVTAMQGKVGNIHTISAVGVSIDFETECGVTISPEEILKVSKNGLPYNVDARIYSTTPTTLYGMLRDKDHEFKEEAEATCRPTDEFSWETGVYGVLIPRLFNCPIRLGV